jgi:hypothetical protein
MTTTTGPAQHPKPKRKQIRLTASAVQQRRVDNLASKRHKSDAHKAAVRLFKAEKQKPDGMSIRLVYDAITAKYETCPSIAAILRKAGTRQHFPNEDGSRWPYFGHGIQVSMPGLKEPHAHQPDECLRGRQLPGEDDPDFCQYLQRIIGLVVFGGKDPKTGLIVGSAFAKGFSTVNNIKAWEKVGAVPLSRKCLQSPKDRRSIRDGDDDQQALVQLIVEHNVIACNALLLKGYNGDMMKVTLKPVQRTTVVTVPHSQERIDMLSQAKTHGSIFSATGGVHLTANDIFKGIVLKQRKVAHEKLAREKTVRERQEKVERNAMIIQAAKGGDVTKLTGANLTVLFTWYQHANVAKMKKDEKLAVWVVIVSSGRASPPYERWTGVDDAKLLEAQSDIVEMVHTALGHLEELKKKELVLA